MSEFRVLLVDDDPDVREATMDLLKSIGAEVSEASNGFFAADFVMRNNPDLVIVDLNMPIMDGIRLVEILKKQGFPPERILVCSATLDKHRLLRLATLKIQHFFVKPVDPKPFLAKVKSVATQTMNQLRTV